MTSWRSCVLEAVLKSVSGGVLQNDKELPLTIDSLQALGQFLHLLINVLRVLLPALIAADEDHDVLQDEALHEVRARVAVLEQLQGIVTALLLVAVVADAADVLQEVAISLGLDVALPVRVDARQLMEVRGTEAVDEGEYGLELLRPL
jgi:hypothetical protein